VQAKTPVGNLPAFFESVKNTAEKEIKEHQDEL
jgi:hypothetical protein